MVCLRTSVPITVMGAQTLELGASVDWLQLLCPVRVECLSVRRIAEAVARKYVSCPGRTRRVALGAQGSVLVECERWQGCG